MEHAFLFYVLGEFGQTEVSLPTNYLGQLVDALIGLEISAEVRTNQGRLDAVIETQGAVYIFEFKLNGSAAEALQQIKDKEYFAPYLLRDKTLHLVGANFEMKKRGGGRVGGGGRGLGNWKEAKRPASVALAGRLVSVSPSPQRRDAR